MDANERESGIIRVHWRPFAVQNLICQQQVQKLKDSSHQTGGSSAAIRGRMVAARARHDARFADNPRTNANAVAKAGSEPSY